VKSLQLLMTNPAALSDLVFSKMADRALLAACMRRAPSSWFCPIEHIGPLFLGLDPKDVGPDDPVKERRPLYEKLSAQDASALSPRRRNRPKSTRPFPNWRERDEACLVIGGAGYVGSHACLALARAGF